MTRVQRASSRRIGDETGKVGMRFNVHLPQPCTFLTTLVGDLQLSRLLPNTTKPGIEFVDLGIINVLNTSLSIQSS